MRVRRARDAGRVRGVAARRARGRGGYHGAGGAGPGLQLRAPRLPRRGRGSPHFPQGSPGSTPSVRVRVRPVVGLAVQTLPTSN